MTLPWMKMVRIQPMPFVRPKLIKRPPIRTRPKPPPKRIKPPPKPKPRRPTAKKPPIVLVPKRRVPKHFMRKIRKGADPVIELPPIVPGMPPFKVNLPISKIKLPFPIPIKLPQPFPPIPIKLPEPEPIFPWIKKWFEKEKKMIRRGIEFEKLEEKLLKKLKPRPVLLPPFVERFIERMEEQPKPPKPEVKQQAEPQKINPMGLLLTIGGFAIPLLLR